LVESWRQAWGRPDLWFLVVQLPNFRARQAEPSESDWAELREAQLMAHRAIPNTGLAVTIDLGEPDDVHPRSKVEVGRRLSLAALGTTYGLDVSPSGPLFLRSRIEGDRVRIWFDHSSSGLVAAGGDPLRGFSIAGADRKFRWARARLEGDTVVVWSEEIGSPMAVRYGWADNPDGNLYSRDGLPASPFRTDDWPGLTNNRR
jgi:sialate O-acetylesterase